MPDDRPLRDVLREVENEVYDPRWSNNAKRLAAELRAIAPLLKRTEDAARDLMCVTAHLETRCPDCGAVIQAHRCGATPAVPAEPVYRPDLAPRYTRQEVDAILKGLRERCMQAACDGVHRNLGCAEMTGRVRDVNLWPASEPERKE